MPPSKRLGRPRKERGVRLRAGPVDVDSAECPHCRALQCIAMLSVDQSASRSGRRSVRRIQAECCEWKAVAKLRKHTSMELGRRAAMQCTRGREAGMPSDGALARESREARVVTHCRCVPRRGGALQCIAMQCCQSGSRAADPGGDLTDGSKPSAASGRQWQS